jgi:hypothetical protein
MQVISAFIAKCAVWGYDCVTFWTDHVQFGSAFFAKLCPFTIIKLAFRTFQFKASFNCWKTVDLIGDRAGIGLNSFIEINSLNQEQKFNILRLLDGYVVLSANIKTLKKSMNIKRIEN